MRTIVVVPAYRERENLPYLVAGIFTAAPGADVLIVDDASGDGTPEWVRAHGDFEKRLFLLARPGKAGLAPALTAGCVWALENGAARIAQMDADLSHDPADLPRLLAELDEADLVIGSRYCEGGGVRDWSWWRLRLSRFAGSYVRFWTGLPVADPTAGFRAFRADVLRQILAKPTRCDGYGFQVEVGYAAWRAGAVLREIPIIFHERRQGSSKLSLRIIFESVLRIPVLRWT
jgi:glycosyltransferase involved in cell wall biosynthesis